MAHNTVEIECNDDLIPFGEKNHLLDCLDLFYLKSLQNSSSELWSQNS